MVVNEPTLENLSERFDRLERQNRRLVSGLLVVLVVVGALLFAGATAKKPSLRAKQLYARMLAVSKSGSTRAGFCVDGQYARLTLFSHAGSGQAGLEGHDAPRLYLDGEDEQRAIIQAWPGSQGLFKLDDYKGERFYRAPPL